MSAYKIIVTVISVLFFASGFAEETKTVPIVETPGGKISFVDKALFLAYVVEGKKKSSTCFLVQKENQLFLVAARHSIRSAKDSKVRVCRAGVKMDFKILKGTWVESPTADVGVMKQPFSADDRPDFLPYAIRFGNVATEIPPRLTKVVNCGYPRGRVLKPIVSPFVRTAEVSSIGTMTRASSSGELRPVFYISEATGMGSSGSPLFTSPDPKNPTANPKVVGVVSGGSNSDAITSTSITPSSHVVALITQVAAESESL